MQVVTIIVVFVHYRRKSAYRPKQVAYYTSVTIYKERPSPPGKND